LRRDVDAFLRLFSFSSFILLICHARYGKVQQRRVRSDALISLFYARCDAETYKEDMRKECGAI